MSSKQGVRKGLLFVLSAPSGCGKTSVLSELLKDPKAPRRCVTYTTRTPRSDEVSGRDYHFVTREEFEKKKQSDFFLEWAEVYGNCYGTARQDVASLIERGQDVIVSVDVQGARTIRSRGEAILIFLVAPSKGELIGRLRGRGTETEESFSRRVAEAEREMAQIELFDYTVTNDTIEHAVQNLMALIEIEREKRRK